MDMSGADAVEGENGVRPTYTVSPWTHSLWLEEEPASPIASFDVATFLEVRRRDDAASRRRLVLLQARTIHDALLRADVHAGFAPILASGTLFPENSKLLIGNGFRVWKIADLHDRPDNVERWLERERSARLDAADGGCASRVFGASMGSSSSRSRMPAAPTVLLSYYVTWDCAADFSFRPHFEKRVAHNKVHADQIVDSSFEEVRAAT